MRKKFLLGLAPSAVTHKTGSSHGISGELLYPIVWKAVRQLESSGLPVLCVTADGASPNRNFFRIHYSEKDSITFPYKARNPYSEDNRWLFFIADPPHLVKTVRNYLSHSSACGTCHMQVCDCFSSNSPLNGLINRVYLLFLTIMYSLDKRKVH